MDSITVSLIFACYIGLISIVSMIVTAVDKVRSKNGKRRVPEKTLILLSALLGMAVFSLQI